MKRNGFPVALIMLVGDVDAGFNPPITCPIRSSA